MADSWVSGPGRWNRLGGALGVPFCPETSLVRPQRPTPHEMGWLPDGAGWSLAAPGCSFRPMVWTPREKVSNPNAAGPEVRRMGAVPGRNGVATARGGVFPPAHGIVPAPRRDDPAASGLSAPPCGIDPARNGEAGFRASRGAASDRCGAAGRGRGDDDVAGGSRCHGRRQVAAVPESQNAPDLSTGRALGFWGW